jgi:hypothetical protein
MRLNSNKLKRLTYGSNRQAQRDSAIADAITLGLDAEAAAREAYKLRISWHGYMGAQHDLESLRAMGFKPSKVRAGTGTVLDDDTLESLYQGFLRIVDDQDFIHTQDPHYYVSQHLADRELTVWEVKQVFKYIEKQVVARPSPRAG